MPDIDEAELDLWNSGLLLDSLLKSFTPRPDQVELFDQQASFVNSTAKVAIACGGTGSGKTIAAAIKCARFILEQQAPPRRDCPFWIISDTYDQVMKICWAEKLSQIIPHWCIDWPRVTGHDRSQELPKTVPLKDWKVGERKNWVLEFKSIDQGREQFQGRSIGGFWFSEQFSWDVFEEVLGRCRDTWYDGGQFAEFTPIDPDLTVRIEQKFDDPPPGWEFFRLNTDLNSAISAEWREQYFAMLGEEELETRRTGAFASFSGQVYKSFNPAVHCLDEAGWERETGYPWGDWPPNVWHRRGIDWGASKEHPFVCEWYFRTGAGDYFVYDEMFDDRALLIDDRIEQIKDRWNWGETDDPAGHRDQHFGMTYADPSRPDLINEFCAGGIPTSAARNNVDKGITCLQRLLRINPILKKPKLFIYRPRCKMLAIQLRALRWLRSSGQGLNPNVARPEVLKRFDDAPDALRYGIFSETDDKDSAATTASREVDYQRHGVHLAGKRR